MAGFLTSYLAGDEDDVTDLMGTTDSPAPLPAPAQEMVTLPGGIVMPKQTFWILVVAISVAVYLVMRKRKQEAEES
jgi:hypothetical protein